MSICFSVNSMLPPYLTAEHKPRLAAAAVRAVAAGILVFALLVSVDQLSVHFGLTGVQRLGDNLLGAIIVGTISFIDDRRRQRNLADRLRVIALMNHHVRNSLQTIMFAQNTDDHVGSMRDAVLRIEWALREILPGTVTETKSGADRRELTQILH